MINIKAFTLVEVIITTVIISILSLCGVTVYRKHLDNVKYNEGLRLIQNIKEQEDLALSFAKDDLDESPFIYTQDVITTTFTFDRNPQNLGTFYIYPHNYLYFRSFEIRKPSTEEENTHNIKGYAYVVETYYPQKNNYQLKMKLIGSSEGSYEIVKERR
ncbi:MAG: prepilin-type N-terminal cleavage/methylation domain-containing protein [Endomicrobium sp.]|nr:prepilin-type N-terminal cleavage/methylation domain-containing protein [Endomicrobium sp.]